ncbi:MAG: hypothetical protein EPN22_17255 [Nitrospirae bacterium]|nr:MAG: hypothetical protein EPN22_17255 [Nitrospirota bacterium]
MSKLAALEDWMRTTKYTGSVLVSATDGGVHEHIVLTPPSKKERLCHLKTEQNKSQTPDQT